MFVDQHQLYQNVISDFEHRMNPLALVEIIIPVARQIKGRETIINNLMLQC